MLIVRMERLDKNCENPHKSFQSYHYNNYCDSAHYVTLYYKKDRHSENDGSLEKENIEYWMQREPIFRLAPWESCNYDVLTKSHPH